MPDQVDELFARFRAGPPLAVPAGADAARQVSRRRRRSRTAAAGVLTAVAVGLPSVGFAVGVFDRPPAVSGPPTSPSPSTAPPDQVAEPDGLGAAVMLRESDLPAGYHRVPLYLIGSSRTLGHYAGGCAFPRSAGVNPLGKWMLEESYERGGDDDLYQVTERMDSSAATEAWLDALPDQLSSHCPRVRFTVVDTGFAGAGSTLIRVTANKGETNFYVFVRQGSLITQLWQRQQTDVAALRELGRVAADRLCEGTPTC
ncbi:hypothetical protein Ais01nite_21290 [Asanoa ishikariensis]|uniref:PknH-like extracellular domain-containing protein n=1 Tax=Asanoa ishikariensis TaxID=137265 RepID=A0A1H3U899_9ACTN|nr:hypothetical protein [Asanoa ishikariensis]GIF64094.1 hypothetical protein Ais01nite_21290 [Asanoa ishikariensis]SDZ58662.1 hypothetical protein SAMN05421684_6744 [Asanoa ishikariensis]